MPTLTVAAPALRALLEGASVAASTDKVLPMLNSVLLEWAPDKLTAVATDRYRMVVGDLSAAKGVFATDDDDEGAALLALADVRELVRALPKARRGLAEPPVTVEVHDRVANFTGDGWARKADTVEADFVRYQAILWDPSDAQPVDRIGFNPAFMASVAKVPTDKGQPWTWRFRGPLKPAIATSSLEVAGGEVAWRFLLMPVRLPDVPTA
jgi:DNA polymerase III sliding clamp (beta) subunit (PCNA family)